MNKKKAFWLYFIPIQLFIIIFLLLPFWQHNNLQIQDMSGHYFSAWYTSNYLFPEGKLTGWSSFHFAGFEQNQTYPPLFTWLVAALTFIMSLDTAFKLVLSVAVLLTPWSFYYFARKIGLKQDKAALAMLGMFSMLFLVYEPVGLNLVSTFNTGLVTSALALPLVFFYLGSLIDGLSKNKVKLSSVLMALLVLTHLFYSVITAILSVCIFIFYRSKWKTYLKHIILSFALSAFWLIPFISKMNLMSTHYSAFYISPLLLYYLPVLALIIYAFIQSLKSDNNNIRAICFSLLALTVLVIICAVFKPSFHFYRLSSVFLLLSIVPLVSIIKKSMTIKTAAILFAVIIAFNFNQIDVKGPELKSVEDIEEVNARILTLSPVNIQHFHTLHYLVPLSSNNDVAIGLFIDGNKNNWHMASVAKITDESAYVTSQHHLPVKDFENYKQLLPYYYNLFNIDYVFKDNKLTKVSDSILVEPLTYIPRVVKQDWDNSVKEWFYSDNVKEVFVDEECCQNVAKGDEIVHVIEQKKNGYLKFKAISDKEIPLLVKVSYSLNWKAYQDGKRIKIYKASPYLMVVEGKGLIELKFERTIWNIFGSILTFLAVLLMFFSSMINNYHKNTKQR